MYSILFRLSVIILSFLCFRSPFTLHSRLIVFQWNPFTFSNTQWGCCSSFFFISVLICLGGLEGGLFMDLFVMVEKLVGPSMLESFFINLFRFWE